MRRAVVLGGARGVWKELVAARKLFDPDLVIATNHAGRDYDGMLDHWVSFHAELLPKWLQERRAANRPDPGRFWTTKSRVKQPGSPLELHRVENWGGSSGLLAVTVALELRCSHVLLCGVPLTRDGEHYDKGGPWIDASNYRRAWLSRVDEMRGIVRSMSGWTADTLGRPDADWIKSRHDRDRQGA